MNSNHRSSPLRAAVLGLVASCAPLAAVDAAPVAVVPAIELSYGGQATPRDALAPLWAQTCAEAGAWWAARSGGQVLGADDIACTGLRLVAATVRRADGAHEGRVSGWWRGAGPRLAGALRAAGPRWPGHRIGVGGDLVRLDGGAGAVDEAAPRPGLQVVVHGAALLAEREGGEPHAPPGKEALMRAMLAGLAHTDVTARVEPDGTGTLAADVPLEGLAPPDAQIQAHLPEHAMVTAIVGVDHDFQTFLGSDVADLREALEEPATTSDAEVRDAVAGTWAVCALDASHVVVVLPASKVAPRLIEALDSGLVKRRWRDSWIVATEVALLDEWDAGRLHERGAYAVPAALSSPAPAWDPATVLRIAVDPGPLLAFMGNGGFIGARALPFLDHLALPAAVTEPAADAAPPAHASVEGMLDALRLDGRLHELVQVASAFGVQRLQLLAQGPHPTLVMTGDLLPWLLPGLAVRWFGDYAADQEGRVLLRQALVDLDRAGAGTRPEDLLVGVPAADRLAAMLAVLTDLGGTLPTVRPQLVERLAGEGLPLVPRPGDAALLEACAGLVRRSAALDDAPPLAVAGLARARADGRLNNSYTSPFAHALHNVMLAGSARVWTGDASGLAAMDRALRQASRPLTFVEGRAWAGLQDLRDEAYLAACVTGGAAAAARDAWLAEPWEDRRAETCRGARLLVLGAVAHSWLDTMPACSVLGVTGFNFRSARVFSAHQHRACTAADCAILLPWLRRAELAPGTVEAEPVLHSFIGASTYGQLAGAERLRLGSRVRHDLMRLAARTVVAAAEGGAPADGVAWSRRFGALQIGTGAERIGLTYEQRGPQGFRLACDLHSPRPTWVPEETWTIWAVAKPAPAGSRIALPRWCLEVVVDPKASGPQAAPSPRATEAIP